MTGKPIYADNAATTPLSQAALDAMTPYFSEQFQNPSAIYEQGARVKSAVETARRDIARCIGARSNEIFFTSGGTEADNWALWGAAARGRARGRHIVTAAAEHSAVYATALRMREAGYEVTLADTDACGAVTPEALARAMRPDTALVSLMAANNEVGTLAPIKELCAAAHARGAAFHTDAVQAAGHIPIDVRELGVDYLSMSAHKFGGPKGVGALYIRYGRTLPPLIAGGGQERGGRSGTTNVPGVAGMAAALRGAVENMEQTGKAVAEMRDKLIQGVLKLPEARLTGHPHNRLPGLASFVFEGFERPPLVRVLGEAGVCASAGSACSAGSGDPSRVLLAAGFSPRLALSSLRFSLSGRNTPREVDAILEALPRVLQKAREEEAGRRRVISS